MYFIVDLAKTSFVLFFQLSSLQGSSDNPMGNKQSSHSEPEDHHHAAAAAAGRGRLHEAAAAADGEDPLVEVPPPMQPISSVPLSAAAAAAQADGDGKVRSKHFCDTTQQSQAKTNDIFLFPSPPTA